MTTKKCSPAVHEATLAPLDARPLAPPPRGEAPRVAECLDARHPSLPGRVLVRWAEGAAGQRWVCALQGTVVRAGDRVLLWQPADWDEPVVVGVLDGLHAPAEAPRVTAATLSLERDEKIQVLTARGDPLVEILAGRDGPVLRLLRDNVDLELPGSLRVSARAIELRARQGEIAVCASDDLVLQGEFVRMN